MARQATMAARETLVPIAKVLADDCSMIDRVCLVEREDVCQKTTDHAVRRRLVPTRSKQGTTHPRQAAGAFSISNIDHVI
jgi:hypothetical protein